MLSTRGGHFEVERKLMTATPFDILRCHLDGGFIWLEAASNLADARARLKTLQASVPGADCAGPEKRNQDAKLRGSLHADSTLERGAGNFMMVLAAD